MRDSKGFVIGDHNVVMQVLGRSYPSLSEFAIDFSDVIESNVKWLSGRDGLLSRLLTIPGKEHCSYVLVEGIAGVGKTALAVGLAQRADAVSFFASSTRGLVRPDQCLNHLSAELIVRFDLDHDHLPSHAGEDSSFFLRVLKEATTKAGRPVWVVIDAIDEALLPPSGANPFLLPDRLPDLAYLVVTARPGGRAIVTAPGTNLYVERLEADGDEQRLAIETFLRRQTAENTMLIEALERSEPPLSSEDFVQRVSTASEGNFMYVAYLLDEWHREPVPNAAALIVSLPPGLAGYYSRVWDRIAEVRGADGWDTWNRLYRPVVECLGVAREPVGAEWLSAHTRQDPYEILERALVRWTGFLRRDITAEPAKWYILHRSFAEFLRDRVDLSRREAEVASFYLEDSSRWLLHDGYPLRHLAEHLASARQTERLFTLVDQRDWYEAHSLGDPTGMGFATDLSVAWSVAELADQADAGQGRSPGMLARELRCALSTASVHSLAFSVPAPLLGQLVAAGMWPPGESLAMIEQIPDAQDRADGLVELSRVLPEPLLGQALNVASAVTDDRARAEALSALAGRLRGDLLASALQQARELAPATAVTALAALSQAQELADDTSVLHTASAIAGEIAEPNDRAIALTGLIPRLSGMDREEAVRRALDALDAWFHLEWTGELAGLELELIETASALSPYVRDDVREDLGRRCETLARALDADGSLRVEGDRDSDRIVSHTITLRNTPHGLVMGDPGGRAVALAMSAALLPEGTGRATFTEAITLAKTLPEEFERDETLIRLLHWAPADKKLDLVAEALTRVLDSHSAELVVQLLPELPEDDQRELAHALLEAGIEAGAIELLVPALAYIGEDERPQALTEALRVTRRVGDDPAQAVALGRLLAHLPASEVGLAFARVKELLTTTEDPELRCVAAEPLVAFLLAQGEHESALQLADSAGLIGSHWARASEDVSASARLLVALLEGLDDKARRSRLSAIFDGLLAARLASGSPQEAWIELAKAIPESRLDAFVHGSQQIPDAADRAYPLAAVAARVNGEMRKEIIVSLIEMIKTDDSSEAIVALAAALPTDPPAAIVAELTSAVQDIKDASSRAKAAIALAPWIDATTFEGVVASSLERARSATWPLNRLAIVRALTQKLPPGRYEDILELARSIQEHEFQAEGIAALVPYATPGRDRDALVDEALTAIEAVAALKSDSLYLSSAVTHITPFMPGPMLDRLVSIVSELSPQNSPLRSVSERVANTEPGKRCELASRLLRAMAKREREQLLETLPQMEALLHALSPAQWASELASEINHSAERWP